MHWPMLTETHVHVIKGSLKGAVRGGAVGTTVAIASGAAVVISTPVWLPVIGGGILVAASKLAVWAAVGSGVGAVTGATWAYVRTKHQERKFREAFGN